MNVQVDAGQSFKPGRFMNIADTKTAPTTTFWFLIKLLVRPKKTPFSACGKLFSVCPRERYVVAQTRMVVARIRPEVWRAST